MTRHTQHCFSGCLRIKENKPSKLMALLIAASIIAFPFSYAQSGPGTADFVRFIDYYYYYYWWGVRFGKRHRQPRVRSQMAHVLFDVPKSTRPLTPHHPSSHLFLPDLASSCCPWRIFGCCILHTSQTSRPFYSFASCVWCVFSLLATTS